MDKFDICIVGAGVVGLAIANSLSASKTLRNRSIVVLERESGFGQQTSSRNSEVIHAGIYYPPGSLKAKLCVRGKQLLYDFCQQHEVPYKRLGKLIVAQPDQIEQLAALKQNAIANGVGDLEEIDRAQLKALEPAIEAHSALLSPSTGILDSHRFMLDLLHQSQQRAVEFAPYTSVEKIQWQNNVFTITSRIQSRAAAEDYEFQCSLLINCAGLQAHLVARQIEGIEQRDIPKIHFCKGDYFSYALPSPIRRLVYPLPDKHTTGLGIHATLDLSGTLRFGPDTQYVEHIDYDVDASKASVFADAIRPYFPTITPQHLLPGYAGIRPKLAAAGSPPQDFVIRQKTLSDSAGLIQLFGIESPGLTSSLAIAEQVEQLVQEHLH